MNMGEFTLPGAPFILWIPDDWTAEMHTLSYYIHAESPNHFTEVVYSRYQGSSIDEVIENTDYSDSFTEVRFELNGMDCVFYQVLREQYEWGPRISSFYAWDFLTAYIEYQGEILRVYVKSIPILYRYVEDEWPDSLLILSRIYPKAIKSIPDEDRRGIIIE